MEGIDLFGPLVGRLQHLPGVNASIHFERVWTSAPQEFIDKSWLGKVSGKVLSEVKKG
jgi:hypothetical protein